MHAYRGTSVHPGLVMFHGLQPWLFNTEHTLWPLYSASTEPLWFRGPRYRQISK